MNWRLSDDDNTNNNNRNNNRSENKSRSRSPYNLRPLSPVDYRAQNSQGTATDNRSASRRSRRAATSRRQSRSTGRRSRASAGRPSRSRNPSVSRSGSEVAQEEIIEVEDEDETDDDPEYTECEVVNVDTTQSRRFTAADKAFYPTNFVEQEVIEALRNQGTLSSSASGAAAGNPFANVGGLGETIDIVRRTIKFPLMYPEFFSQFQIKPDRGLIFHGPPGVGKTLMAQALVDCCSRYTNRKIAFFERKGSDILNSYVGQSEANLIKLFDAAKQLSPSIIFIDEVDALAPIRTSNENNRVETNVVSTLLALMDGLEDRGMVFVIGATNRLEAIDPALRRPGRFDLEIRFEIPDQEARRDILSKVTSTWGLNPSIIDTVAGRTNGFSGADLAQLCKTAAFNALVRTNPGIVEDDDDDDDDSLDKIDTTNIRVKMEDFDKALLSVQPSNQRLQNN